MALPDTDHEKKPDPYKKEKPATKVVIRRLPPSMDSQTFLHQIAPVPPYDYFYLVKGDASLGDNCFARAYINFTNHEDIYDFKEKFDNYVFVDTVGHEYPAVVEFAAFQKIPKRRTKIRVDPKVATIETDPCYLEFVEMINKPPSVDEKPEYTYQLTSENKNLETTPLLEFVKNRRAEKMRIREERREERKRKDFERKKYRDDERKKRFDEKSPVKSTKPYGKPTTTSPKEKNVEEVEEKTVEKDDADKQERSSTTYYKSREKKYEERKKDIKPKYIPKGKRRPDYKERDYRPKFDDFKPDDTKPFQKKVKKYSEKREERKIEAQKAEQKKLELEGGKAEGDSSEGKECSRTPDEKKDCKETDAQAQRRIRNKDRPTIAIYRPGMLSKRKQTEGDGDSK